MTITEPHYMCENFGQGLIVFSAVVDGEQTVLPSGRFQSVIDCLAYARSQGFCVEESCREVIFENPKETIRVTRWFEKERIPA